jgi:[ribosomal protein S18]-alanine N-acetyltransferase
MGSSYHKPHAVLRPATPNDLPGIAEIERLSFIHAGERFTDRRVRFLIENPRSIVTVAAEAGDAPTEAGDTSPESPGASRPDRPLGWAAGYVWLRGAEPWGRIYALAVHPEARGQRLGQRLLEEMIQSLRARGAGRIFLEVRTDNHAAIALYERFGFAACRTLHNYYGHNLDAQRMALPK